MAKFEWRLTNGVNWVTVEGDLPQVITNPGGAIVVRSIGPSLTLAAVADLLRVPEITMMTGNRTAIVPQSYHDVVTADAFNPLNHSVGDPLVPTCAIYTHKAIRSGNWSDPTMWDVGTTPHAATDGTAVVCSGEYDVVYDVLSDVKIKDVHINGKGSLTFARNARTRLWVDTIMCDGKLIMGEHGNPIPDSGVVTSGKRQPQCEVVFWQSEAPLKSSRLGLNTMGPVRIHGAEKVTRRYATASILADADTITFTEPPTGWQVGDEILICATEYAGTGADPQYTGPTQHYNAYKGSVRTHSGAFIKSQDEVRTITDITGNTVTLNAPLTYNHNRYQDVLPRGDVVDLKPAIAMLTHSIRFRTADSGDTAIWAGANLAVRQKRAHMMFMFNDDVQIRYAESKNMGRTDTDASLADPDGTIRYATSNTSQPITDVNNVRGRYPWHIHRTGAFFGRKQVVLQGVSVWAPLTEVPIPGWGITHHDSRAAIENCVALNIRGAGIVSELGNETGQWLNNTVSYCRGDSSPYNWAERTEIWENHNGHMGAAYENQARQILQQGNIATSSRVGWMYLQQDVKVLNRIPDEHSLRFRDPITQGGGGNVGGDFNLDFDTYGVEEAQVPDFFDNHVFGCYDAFFKSHQQFTDRTDKTPFIFKRFHCINCVTTYNMANYTFVYYFYDSLWIGNDKASSVGGNLGAVSWENVFVNMKLCRMNKGFFDAGIGIGYQTYWLDLEFGTGAMGVNIEFDGPLALDFGVDPTTKNTYGIMGPWTITGATTAKPRTWATITTASLPVAYPLAPFGPDSAFRAANPCPDVGDEPYVVLNGVSDLNAAPTTVSSIIINAVIVDSLGYRMFGDNQSPESNHAGMTPKTTRTVVWTTGNELVYRNGCFNDGGTWKSRLWFQDIDRATGNHFVHPIDITLVGFNAGFLASNTVDPVATKPETPILPETMATGAIASTNAPVIVTGSTHFNTETQVLSIPLKANTGLVRWAVTGGTDAADFEVAFVGGQWVLRWASNGTKDYEVPDDTGTNNVYDVDITCTNFTGQTASQSMVVTVTDLTEIVVDPFYDSFSRAVEPLEASPNWERVNGTAGGVTLSGVNGYSAGVGSILPQNVGAKKDTIYLAPRTGSAKHFVESRIVRNFAVINVILNYTDTLNYVLVYLDGITFRVQRMLNGTLSTIGTPGSTFTGGALMRFEWDDATESVTVIKNSVADAPIAVTGLPVGTRVGFVRSSTDSSGATWASFRSGSY